MSEPTEKHREAAHATWREWVASADEDSTLMGPEFIEHLARALAAAEEAGLERAAQAQCLLCAQGRTRATTHGEPHHFVGHDGRLFAKCDAAAIRRLKGGEG